MTEDAQKAFTHDRQVRLQNFIAWVRLEMHKFGFDFWATLKAFDASEDLSLEELRKRSTAWLTNRWSNQKCVSAKDPTSTGMCQRCGFATEDH